MMQQKVNMNKTGKVGWPKDENHIWQKKTKINKHSTLILSQNVVSKCDLISELTELNKEIALIELSDGDTCMITT